MNGAFAYYLGKLYTGDEFFRGYERMGTAGMSLALAAYVWRTKDNGYASDVADSSTWSQLLGVDEWFGWVKPAAAVKDERT